MKYVVVTLRNKKEFLKALLGDRDEGDYFYITRDEFAVDEEVAVRFIFRDLKMELYLRGTVTWRRPQKKATTELPAGIAIRFLDAERPKFEYLVALSEGKRPPRYTRTHSRVPVDLKLTFVDAHDKKAKLVQAVDLSEQGAFVAYDDFIPQGTPIVLKIQHDSLLWPLRIPGVIVRHGEESGIRGFGVRFQLTPRRQRKIARILEALQDFD